MKSEDDFEVICRIGTGNFSEVFLVENLLDRKQYALKKVSKMELIRHNKEPEVIMEKHCLLKLNDSTETNKYPNHLAITTVDTICCTICSISYDFKTIQRLLKINSRKHIKLEFIVCIKVKTLLYKFTQLFKTKTFYALSWSIVGTEIIDITQSRKKEVWDLINGVGLLNHNLAKLYIAQIVLALEYCHLHHILHRDLKAENILICSDGTLRLIDFGTSLDLSRPDIKSAGNSQKGFTGKRYEHFVGTVEFMAIETIHNKPPTFMTDLWSLGCVIYQILAGIPPFFAPTSFYSHLLTVNLIYEFPPHFPEDAKDLVSKLICKNPEDRLGAKSLEKGLGEYSIKNKKYDTKGLQDIKDHEFFKSIDFENIIDAVKSSPKLASYGYYCLGHISEKWDIYLDQLKQFNLYPNEAAETDSSQSPLSEEEINYWMRNEKPLYIAAESRKLIESYVLLRIPQLKQAYERVLYIQHLKDPKGLRPQSFWDELAENFLNNPNPEV